jgi:hypothetical protein
VVCYLVGFVVSCLFVGFDLWCLICVGVGFGVASLFVLVCVGG